MTMIIAQITDTHLSDVDAADPKFGVRAENLRACIADINDLDPLPDAVIHTGDITQHGRAGGIRPCPGASSDIGSAALRHTRQSRRPGRSGTGFYRRRIYHA